MIELKDLLVSANILVENELDPNLDLADCDWWDSMNRLLILVEAETTYGIALEGKRLLECQSIFDLETLLKEFQ